LEAATSESLHGEAVDEAKSAGRHSKSLGRQLACRKKVSSTGERTRSLTETLLNYQQPARAVRAAEDGTLAIIRTHSFAETRFELLEYFQSGIASTGYEVHHDNDRNLTAK
jgi:hypothetical protein